MGCSLLSGGLVQAVRHAKEVWGFTFTGLSGSMRAGHSSQGHLVGWVGRSQCMGLVLGRVRRAIMISRLFLPTFAMWLVGGGLLEAFQRLAGTGTPESVYFEFVINPSTDCIPYYGRTRTRWHFAGTGEPIPVT